MADETGLPALLAILETLPAGHRAIAFAVVKGEAEHQPIETAAETELRWLDAEGLTGAVRELELPWGHGHVWGGGESRAMRTVRDRLRRRPEVKQMQVLGYWSRARSPR